jgi:hypothetical protein
LIPQACSGEFLIEGTGDFLYIGRLHSREEV